MMKIKINWGWSIALVYMSAAMVLFYAVYKSFGVERNLVVDSYYQEDLHYQQKFEKMLNAKKLGNNLEMDYLPLSNEYHISFPPNLSGKKGSLHFYKPDDKALDFEIPFNSVEDSLNVTLPLLHKGKWKIFLQFKEGEKEYYRENDLIL